MATATDTDVQEFRAEMKQLRADFADLQATLGNLVRHGGAEAAAKARESGERVWGEAKKQVDGVRQKIEEKPVTSAATAFGVGMILGMLFSSRRG